MENEIKQLHNETPDEYRIRLQKNQQAYGLTNKEIGDLLNEAYGVQYDESAWRKRTRPYLTGYEDGINSNKQNEDLLNEIRKERIKLQTLNVERNQIDRQEARRELFYEQIANHIDKIDNSGFVSEYIDSHSDNEYVLTIGDIHYGYVFQGINNEYSPDVARKRLSVLAEMVKEYCHKENVNVLKIVNLGDNIHGILRVNDLRVNQSGIVAATVEVANMLGQFIKEVAGGVKRVEQYHVPESNHAQIRPLGSKASEIVSEDMEQIITEFLKVQFANCKDIQINTNAGKTYIEIPISDTFSIAKHGHDIKNIETASKDLSYVFGIDIDFMFLGHFHSTKEYTVGINPFGFDRKIFVCPAIVGSDPYADKIMRGSCPGAELFEFDSSGRHIGTKHFIL